MTAWHTARKALADAASQPVRPDGSGPREAYAVPERPATYPEPSMRGVLPAYEFYIRHADGIQMDGITIGFMTPDTRPAFVLDDVKDITFHDIRASQARHKGELLVGRIQAGPSLRRYALREGRRLRSGRQFLVVAATILFAACGGSEAAVEPIVTSVAGTWNLTAVNDKALPFILQASDPKLELTDRQLVFSATGTFTLAYTIRATELDGKSSTSKVADSGTSTLANNVITMQYQKDGTSATGSVSGNKMTFAAGVTQTYTKQ